MESDNQGRFVRGRVVGFPGRPADVRYELDDVLGESGNLSRLRSRGRLGWIIIVWSLAVGVAIFELVRW